mmetsp:Transcript_23891/g.26510  ORF Transcript_23891/g.26510 Transcript_23891/m.26510 type:complete len:186 (+) Transcript_23891:1420-1977(+)
MIFINTPETRLFGKADLNGKPKRYYSLTFGAIYTALSRPIYVFGLGLLLAGPLTGKGSLLQVILGGRFYAPWAKLTFYGYMVHLFVFSFYFAQIRQAIYLSHATVLFAYIGVIIVTLLISIVLSIAFESPLIQLERLVLFPPKKRSQSKPMLEEMENPVGVNHSHMNTTSVKSDTQQTEYQELKN